MVSGIGAALILSVIDFPVLHRWPLTNNPSMNAFPFIFLISIVGCLIGTLFSKPESDETLKKFYKNVRPWGFWNLCIKK